ncbi:MAG: hypothetical protein AAGE94_12130, partial [Acidobacteriota bacterium]
MSRRRAHRPVVRFLFVALCLFVGLGPAIGQRTEDPTESPTEDKRLRLLDQLQTRPLADLDLSDLGARAYDEDVWAQAALDALYSFRNVRARELTEAILEQDPESIAGLCLLGMVYHRVEANLPRALYHLSQCRERFESRFGPYPSDGSPWQWHGQAILGQAMVAGEM